VASPYFVVVEPSGVLRPVQQVPTVDVIVRELYPAWVGRVWLGEQVPLLTPLVAFVGDPRPGTVRNPVGSCLLSCLGAPLGRYTGPIVITGWNLDTGVALSTAARITAFGFDLALLIADTVDDIRAAAEGLATGHGPDWDGAVRAHTARVADLEPTRPASWLTGHHPDAVRRVTVA
jgi:hypothetical protein